jgi:pyruvate formate lyase activating enzyme
MKEAILYNKKEKRIVNCFACNQHCTISPNQIGICGVRKNIDGTLFSLNYGKIIAENVDPIEKKPLYHFLPGSLAYSIATIGCNFKCLHCQNADISQLKSTGESPGRETSAQDIINRAIKNNCQSIAYTYTEPTIFIEFAIETMRLAKKQGLKNVWVSNGYFTEETLKLISPLLDAINVDLKFFHNENYQKICGAKLEAVLNNLKLLFELKKHLEITTLIIPGINDSSLEIKNIATFIKDELSQNIPWHISAFHPAYKIPDLPKTTKESIVRAYEIGKKVGLNYVYAGNIIGETLDNTYCPKCGYLLIDRIGYIIKSHLNKPKCPQCQCDLGVKL